MAQTKIPAALLAGGIGASLVDKSGTWNFTGTLQEDGQDVVRVTEVPGSNDFKESAKAITVNVTNLSSPGTLRSGAGRVGLVSQSTPTQNGLYDFVDGTTALTRCTDADSDAEVSIGMAFFDDASGEMWVLTNKGGNLGSGDLTFTKRLAGSNFHRQKLAADGTTTVFDLGHSKVDILAVSVAGVAMTEGSTEDYEVQEGAGTGGVDTITFATAPPNGTNVSVNYAVRS